MHSCWRGNVSEYVCMYGGPTVSLKLSMLLVCNKPDEEMLSLPQRCGAMEERARYGRRSIAGTRPQLVLVTAPVNPTI